MFDDYIVPEQCPACNSVDGWKCVGVQKKGFSLGKAAVGGLLLGPVGLLGGAMGKKTLIYYCTDCGYTGEYKTLST